MIGIVLFVHIGFQALRIEENENKYIGVRKQEYIRVMRQIIQDLNSNNDSNISSKIKKDDRSTSSQYYESDQQHDSFYFLQKNLERRANKKKRK